MIGKNVNVRSWETNLFNAIKDVSDLEMQREVWMGNNPNLVSSYDEIIMVLYDDNDFLNYIEYYKSLKGEDKLYKLFVDLIGMIDNYDEQDNDGLVLKDPFWIDITNKAKEIVPLLHFTT